MIVNEQQTTNNKQPSFAKATAGKTTNKMFEQNVTLAPGTGTFSQHTFEIIIMLLGAFLIGLWLGWALWAKYKQQIDRMTLETQSLNVTTDALRTELAALKSRLATVESESNSLSNESIMLNSENSKLRDKINALEIQLADALAENRQLDTELGLALEPDTPIADDIPLEVIENVKELKGEREDAPVYAPGEKLDSDPIEVPAAEPVEAPAVAMAENAPAPMVIEPMAIAEPPAEKKKNAAKKGDGDKPEAKIAAASSPADDLTVIEGIGPKIQMLLNQYNISTYKQLAETEVDRLKEILATAGPQLAMHDPGTWPSQANLAANDQWDTLKSVQGFLKGGKKPD